MSRESFAVGHGHSLWTRRAFSPQSNTKTIPYKGDFQHHRQARPKLTMALQACLQHLELIQQYWKLPYWKLHST